MRTDRRPAASGADPSGDGAKILAFRPRPRTARAGWPRISDPLGRMEAEDDRRRMRENLAAALIIVLLFGIGYLVISELRASARIAACLEAAHRNCMPLDLETPQGR
jgi:hypothetical protein